MTYYKRPAPGQATMANSEPVVIASDQSAVPVSGTVTANLSATDNAVLDQIELNQDSQTAILTTIDTDTGALVTSNAAIQTAVQLIDNAISGSEMQVDVVAPLPAGTNNIGDVDVLTINGVAPAFGSGVRGATVQRVTIATDDSVPVTIATVPSHPVTNAGTFAVQNTAATPAGTNNIGDVDVLTVGGVTPAFGSGVRGATVQRVTIATDDSVPVTLAANQSVNVAQINGVATTTGNGVSGTGVQRVTIASDGTGQLSTVTTVGTVTNITNQGQIVDDAAATLGTTRAFAVGGIAVAMDGTDPLAVSAEGDAALLRSDPNRILLVNQTHPRFFRAAADYASAQTNTSVVAAPGAGLSLYVTDIVISNGATAGNITLLDGSGGSLLFEVYPAVNGGVAHSFRNPIKLTANTALVVTSQTVTTHALTVTGYIAA